MKMVCIVGAIDGQVSAAIIGRHGVKVMSASEIGSRLVEGFMNGGECSSNRLLKDGVRNVAGFRRNVFRTVGYRFLKIIKEAFPFRA
ncbi:hypothetical protein EV666_101128 [Camelimonas lactis]|uniref:Uncharacterized protein n=1 Tax=Camelimonas lactis TaxID=659006 RepID=A0A4R2GXD5_9HYPH|nr:hypothetical protein EV666_101128 [Camelimonas lactis]